MNHALYEELHLDCLLTARWPCARVGVKREVDERAGEDQSCLRCSDEVAVESYPS